MEPTASDRQSSVPLTWECTNPSPNFVWSLGERVEQVGKPAWVKNVVAFVERTTSGDWRWVAYVGGGSICGFEPSCDHAMGAAERALSNVIATAKRLPTNT